MIEFIIMTFKQICKLLILLPAMILFVSQSPAQMQEGETLDKIAAVVGKEIILKSDIDSYVAVAIQQDPSISKDSERLRKEILNNLINENLVVTKAIEDSVEVSDEEVEQRLELLIQQGIRRYGSEKRLEDVYGMSIERLRYEYRDIVRKQLLAETLKRQKFANIKVTPAEVKEFYEEYKDSLPPVPPQVELYHIVRNVETDSSTKMETFKLAKRVRDSIVAGADFGEMAKKYSDDTGTKSDGGELGWVEKGKLFPEFEKAAFQLQENEISLPVETPFGFHIIQTLKKEENRIKTRHILFKLGQSGTDRDEAKEFLLDLKEKVLKEGESFEKLAREFSDDKETKGFGGLIGKMTMSELPAETQKIVKELPEGGISDPMPYNADPTKPAYHILYKKEFIPQHEPNLDEDYKRLEQFAMNKKQNQLYQEWIQELRAELFWEIKE